MSQQAIRSVDINGNQYIPLADALEQIGGTVQWDNTNKQAHVVSGARTALINMANEDVEVNGSTVRLSRPPLVKDDTLYVPVDFFDNVLQQQIFLA
jgi:hypothetical protein